MVAIAVENIIGIDCTSKLFLSDRTVQLVMRARVPRTALSRSLSQFQLEWQFTRTLAVWYTYFTICYLFRFNVGLICWFFTRAVCYFILFRIHRYLFRLLRSCTHSRLHRNYYMQRIVRNGQIENSVLARFVFFLCFIPVLVLLASWLLGFRRHSLVLFWILRCHTHNVYELVLFTNDFLINERFLR